MSWKKKIILICVIGVLLIAAQKIVIRTLAYQKNCLPFLNWTENFSPSDVDFAIISDSYNHTEYPEPYFLSNDNLAILAQILHSMTPQSIVISPSGANEKRQLNLYISTSIGTYLFCIPRQGALPIPVTPDESSEKHKLFFGIDNPQLVAFVNELWDSFVAE